MRDGTECEFSQISALTTVITHYPFISVQGELVNNIERSVLEAQEYVEQAKESIPKCQKYKKTGKRVRRLVLRV